MTVLQENASLFVCNDRAKKRIVQELFFRFGGSCYKCSQQLDINESKIYPTALIVLVAGELHPRKLCCPNCAPAESPSIRTKHPSNGTAKVASVERPKLPVKYVVGPSGKFLPTLQRLFLAQGGNYAYCKTQTRIIKGGGNFLDRATIDHMKPSCRGGANHIQNKVLACFECNNLKGAMTVREFLNAVYLFAYQLRGMGVTSERDQALSDSRPMVGRPGPILPGCY